MALVVKNRHYALLILTLVYVFNFLDRQLLAILVEPIKAEFQVSDTAMGLLYGLSFALFYATLAIPVAHYADRKNRRNIVATAASVWSAFTVLCGFAGSFWQLFLFRTGVAVGEAGGVPPSQSMITDLYPHEQRAKAMAVFSSASFIGSLVAFIGGAYIAEQYGWRMAFVVVGLPGIALALILRFTVPEPIRGHWDEARQEAAVSEQTFKQTFKVMLSHKTMQYTLLGAGFASMAGYAIGYWAPSFLIRVHGVSLIQAGTMIGVIGISCGLIGSLMGAALCDHLAKTNRKWLLFIPAISLILSLPTMWAFLYWPESSVQTFAGMQIPTAIYLFAMSSFVGSWWAAPTYVAVQEVVAPNQRTLACAILLFIMNLVGFGFGPFLVGALTDFLAHGSQLGNTAIRYSLIAVMSAYLLAIVFYVAAGRSFVPSSEELRGEPA